MMCPRLRFPPYHLTRHIRIRVYYVYLSRLLRYSFCRYFAILHYVAAADGAAAAASAMHAPAKVALVWQLAGQEVRVEGRGIVGLVSGLGFSTRRRLINDSELTLAALLQSCLSLWLSLIN